MSRRIVRDNHTALCTISRLMYNRILASLTLLALTTTTGLAADRSLGVKDIYFGNLHAHTAVSDGTGTPAEAFAYARDVAKLDFMALTEHNHLLAGEHATPEQRKAIYTGPVNSALIPTSDRFTTPGKFVAIYGQEFSSISKGNHVNVYDVTAPILPTDVPNGDFAGLLKWMAANPDSSGAPAIMQLNHPGLGMRPGTMLNKNTYGRDDFGDDTGWLKSMTPVTQLLELLNGEPPKGILGKRSSQIAEEYYRAFLQLGFRVAPTGNQDNHKPDWGDLTETRTGIIAPELTRPAILAAMRARHVYATEDVNLRLIVRVNGQLAGDVIPSRVPLGAVKVEFEIADADEPYARYDIDVFGGTIGGPEATIVKSIKHEGSTAPDKPAAIDGLSLEKNGQFLFLRFTQRAGDQPDRAWTAPVWLDIK